MPLDSTVQYRVKDHEITAHWKFTARPYLPDAQDHLWGHPLHQDHNRRPLIYIKQDSWKTSQINAKHTNGSSKMDRCKPIS